MSKFSIPVIPYDSKFRVFWNVFIVLSILAATIIFSYRMVHGEDKTDFIYVLFTVIFSLDIFVNLNLSVKKKLDVISDRPTIIKTYLRSWFIFDFLAAFPFPIFIGLFRPETLHNPVVANILASFWFFRLLKLTKASGTFREIQTALNINPGVMRLSVFAFWFIQMVHFIALGWIMIGAVEQNRSHMDQYIRALYWTVTTVATIGYGDYYPNHEKNVEIIFTIVAQIFGVGMYGYIIGNVSGLIANLDVAKANFLKKLEEVNDYMRTKSVPAPLQQKVRNYYNYLWETQKSAATGSVMEELPYTLAMEISLFMNRGILEKVSLFRNANDIFIREITQLLKPMVFLPNDYIIRQGEFGDCMYFLSVGDVEVVVNNNIVAHLGTGSPFGETALIQGEKRTASIRAVSYCDVYKLEKSDFDVLRSKYPEFDTQVKQVAEANMRDTQAKTKQPKE
ncbi:MAG: ion transporter [Spirochaetes bacterium]|nr:ion transporter [Spirochaetota bacterium]